MAPPSSRCARSPPGSRRTRRAAARANRRCRACDSAPPRVRGLDDARSPHRSVAKVSDRRSPLPRQRHRSPAERAPHSPSVAREPGFRLRPSRTRSAANSPRWQTRAVPPHAQPCEVAGRIVDRASCPVLAASATLRIRRRFQLIRLCVRRAVRDRAQRAIVETAGVIVGAAGVSEPVVFERLSACDRETRCGERVRPPRIFEPGFSASNGGNPSVVGARRSYSTLVRR